MSAPILVPFNFESIEDLTDDNYTVPDGSYVYAEPLDPRCTVDGGLFIVSSITFPTSNGYDFPPTGDYRVTASNSSSGGGAFHQITYRGIIYEDNLITSSTTFCSDSFPIASTLPLNLSSVGSSDNTTPAARLKLIHTGATDRTVTIDKIERRSGWHKKGVVLAGGDWYIRRFRSLRA